MCVARAGALGHAKPVLETFGGLIGGAQADQGESCRGLHPADEAHPTGTLKKCERTIACAECLLGRAARLVHRRQRVEQEPGRAPGVHPLGERQRFAQACFGLDPAQRGHGNLSSFQQRPAEGPQLAVSTLDRLQLGGHVRQPPAVAELPRDELEGVEGIGDYPLVVHPPRNHQRLFGVLASAVEPQHVGVHQRGAAERADLRGRVRQPRWPGRGPPRAGAARDGRRRCVARGRAR
jgi:hypothetical protein